MIGRFFPLNLNSLSPEPLIDSWLNAIDDSRRRTHGILEGIRPGDAVVKLMREKHQLLIGEPTAELAMMQLGSAEPDQPRTWSMKGRSLVTGLPAAVEISSIEVQAVDNSEASIAYMDWFSKAGDPTLGSMLYSLAAHEANWLFIGVLKQDFPAELEGLFVRDQDKLSSWVRGQTFTQHWDRLLAVRYQLHQTYEGMNLEDFRRSRQGARSFCSAEWVLHELCQYEAECRVTMRNLYADVKEALNGEADKA
jgi:hypothetical protein